VTFGLGYPYALWRVMRFVLTNHQYGNTRFAWYGKPSQYYMIVLRMLAIQFTAVLLVGLLAFSGSTTGVPSATSLMLVGFLVYGISALAFAYTQAAFNNLMYNQLVVGWHRFESTLDTLSLL